MKNKFILILGVLIVLGCKNNTKEIDVEKATKDDKTEASKMVFNEDLNKIDFAEVELLTFKKTNGIERNVFGMNFYEIEFEAKIKAITEIDFYNDRTYMWHKFLQTYDVNDIKKKKQLNFRTKERLIFPVNTELKIDGTILLEKTDNGWRKSQR